MLDGINVDAVTNDLASLERTYSEFSDLYARACGLLGDDDSEEVNELHSEIMKLMESVDDVYLDSKGKACSWLMQKEKDQEDIEALCCKRLKGSKSSSSRSSSKSGSKSKSRSGSEGSECSQMSLRQKAKVAGLKAEADALKVAKQKELSAELSRLDVNIKKAEAIDKVYSSYAAEVGSQIDD